MGLQRRQVVVAALVIGAALGYLLFTGMRDTMVFYYTVDEVLADPAGMQGQALRVAGKVVPGSLRISERDQLDRRFVISAGGHELEVVYRGVTPDTLVDRAEAVVEGRLGPDGVFHATHVMAKCPSKYEAETDLAKYRKAGIGVRGDTLP